MNRTDYPCLGLPAGWRHAQGPILGSERLRRGSYAPAAHAVQFAPLAATCPTTLLARQLILPLPLDFLLAEMVTLDPSGGASPPPLAATGWKPGHLAASIAHRRGSQAVYGTARPRVRGAATASVIPDPNMDSHTFPPKPQTPLPATESSGDPRKQTQRKKASRSEKAMRPEDPVSHLQASPWDMSLPGSLGAAASLVAAARPVQRAEPASPSSLDPLARSRRQLVSSVNGHPAVFTINLHIEKHAMIVHPHAVLYACPLIVFPYVPPPFARVPCRLQSLDMCRGAPGLEPPPPKDCRWAKRRPRRSVMASRARVAAAKAKGHRRWKILSVPPWRMQ